MPISLCNLPAELRAIVLSYLPRTHDRAAIAKTCRLLRDEVDVYLYSEVVLRDIGASRALHAAFISKPHRLLLVKHITYLYPFGDDQDAKGNGHYFVHYYRRSKARATGRYSVKTMPRPFFTIACLNFLVNLRSFTVHIPGQPSDLVSSPRVKLPYNWTKSYCEHFLLARSQEPHKLVTVDINVLGTRLENNIMDELAYVFSVWTLETIHLSHLNAGDLTMYSTTVLIDDEYDFKLQHLTMTSCEINSIGLVQWLQKTKKLKSIRFQTIDGIEGHWEDTETSTTLVKGRWSDILQAIEMASLTTQLEVLELTSRDEYSTAEGPDKSLDFANFYSLKELTIDAQASIKGLPDSLRTLTFVRAKNFKGACLPILENRLREVRKCCLSTGSGGMQRKVIFRIPDRSRGYESLRVMADTWRSIGFVPKIEVDE